MRGIKYIATPPSWLPFLVYEYGLGELSPFVPNLYNLINEGIQWQRVRGTPDSIDRALDWLGYAADIEQEPIRRRRWHLMQLELDRVRDVEVPDLDRIEGVTQLSLPVRSHFWRGWHGYDARGFEFSYSKHSGAMWSDVSGARLRPGAAKWSFGRKYEIDHIMTEAELTALGVWLPEVGAGVDTWAHVVWPHQRWSEPTVAERRKIIIDDMLALGAWITFKTAGGAIIGHRRLSAFKSVASGDASSPYEVGGFRVKPDEVTPIALYVECLTDFGDGYGSTAAKWEVRMGASLAPGVKPGKAWLEPAELTGGIVAQEIASTIEFGRTVRERCKALLRVV